MFCGIEKSSGNKRTRTILENSVLEKKISRYIVFGDDKGELKKLSQSYLTSLNVQGFKTEYYDLKSILKEKEKIEKEYFSRNPDIIVLDGLDMSFESKEREAIYNILNLYQHSHIFITSSLSVKEMFSDDMRDYFDEKGVIWSRNILGCNQLFMNDEDRLLFINYLKQENSGDYRKVISTDYHSVPVIPYYELDFLTQDMVQQVLAEGDDSVNNCLVIDKNNKLKLIGTENMNSSEIKVRLESFASGNGYVGKESRAHNPTEFYRMLLEGYLMHLNTGSTEYVDTSLSGKTNRELIREIKENV